MTLTAKIEFDTDSTKYSKEQLVEMIEKILQEHTNVEVKVEPVVYVDSSILK